MIDYATKDVQLNGSKQDFKRQEDDAARLIINVVKKYTYLPPNPNMFIFHLIAGCPKFSA